MAIGVLTWLYLAPCYLGTFYWRLFGAFAHQNLKQAADVAMLFGLRVDPVADHLLLGAHVVDQPLNSFGQVGHGGGGRSARAAVITPASPAVPRSRTVVDSQSSSSV